MKRPIIPLLVQAQAAELPPRGTDGSLSDEEYLKAHQLMVETLADATVNALLYKLSQETFDDHDQRFASKEAIMDFQGDDVLASYLAITVQTHLAKRLRRFTLEHERTDQGIRFMVII